MKRARMKRATSKEERAERRRVINRLVEAGMSRPAIAHHLNMDHSTVYYYAPSTRGRGRPHREDEPEPMLEIHGPVPTLFRCEMCNGVSSDPVGHELCVNRLRERAA